MQIRSPECLQKSLLWVIKTHVAGFPYVPSSSQFLTWSVVLSSSMLALLSTRSHAPPPLDPVGLLS